MGSWTPRPLSQRSGTRSRTFDRWSSVIRSSGSRSRRSRACGRGRGSRRRISGSAARGSCTPIGGATSARYEAAAGDVGFGLRVAASSDATDPATSATTALVVEAPQARDASLDRRSRASRHVAHCAAGQLGGHGSALRDLVASLPGRVHRDQAGSAIPRARRGSRLQAQSCGARVELGRIGLGPQQAHRSGPLEASRSTRSRGTSPRAPRSERSPLADPPRAP